MLTVSMPTYQTPPALLTRAVDGVLTQTVDLRLVVVNDGGTSPELPADPRLTVLDLPANRGRYFADAVVAAATDVGWFAVHDADDVADPDHYEQLIGAALDGAALGPWWVYPSGTVVEPRPQLAGSFRHVGHWAAGVWSVDRMRRVGGIHPGFRVGWDTVHMLLMLDTGPVGIASRPTYHWHRRPGSLSMAAETGKRSALRRQATRRLSSLYRQARRADDPAAVVRRAIPETLTVEVDAEAARLRTLLEGD